MKVPAKPTPAHMLDEARDAARAYQAMCAICRISGRPTVKLFKRLEKARAAINRWDAHEEQPSAKPAEEKAE